jgi:hypothetical protein
MNRLIDAIDDSQADSASSILVTRSTPKALLTTNNGVRAFNVFITRRSAR